MADKQSETPEAKSEEKAAAPAFKVVYNRLNTQVEIQLTDGYRTFVPPRSSTPPILASNLPGALPAGLTAVDHVE